MEVGVVWIIKFGYKMVAAFVKRAGDHIIGYDPGNEKFGDKSVSIMCKVHADHIEVVKVKYLTKEEQNEIQSNQDK